MTQSETLSSDQLAVLQELKDMDRRQVKVQFRNSAVPEMQELDGEYTAQLLDQGTAFANWLIGKAFRTAGNWRGKAFQATTSEYGIGYNLFDDRGAKGKRLPMLTYYDHTPFAGGRSFILDYASTNRGIIRTMRGHVRRWKDGVYLGFGTVGPNIGDPDKFRRKIPFVLIGPTAPFDLPQELQYLRTLPKRKSAA